MAGRPGLRAALAFLLGSSPALALAGDDAAGKAAAQVLFDDARALTAAGDYAQACPKLLESARLDPAVGTRFYLADCYEHIGKLASAWTYYLEAADAAQAAGKKDRADFAHQRADALKPRLARLSVVVPEALRALPDLAVQRDGLGLGAPLWGTPVPVDPGRHLIRVTATGKAPWEAAIEAGEEGKTTIVEVPPLADPPKAVPVRPVVTAAPLPVTPPPPPPVKASSTQRWIGYGVGGVGVIGLGVGAAFGGVAIGKQGQSNDGPCDAQNTCDANGKALRREAISAATASTAGVVVGGLLLAGGVVLVLTAPRATSAAATPVAVSIGPSGLAIGGWF